MAIIPICLFIWFFWGPGKENLPETVGTVEIDTLKAFEGEDTSLEDSTHIVEINYYNNKNQNGAEMFEIKFSTYMGTDISKTFSKGVQIYNSGALEFKYKHKRTDTRYGFLFAIAQEYNWQNIVSNQLVSYYDISYEKETQEPFVISNSIGLSQDGAFIISIGDQLAKMNFKFEEMLDCNLINYNKTIFGSEFFTYAEIDEIFFLYHMLQNTKSLEEGTHFVKLDVSPYFNIALYNEESKQFDKITADTQFTFLRAKINVNNDGCNTKTQSMFGMIAGNDESKYEENLETDLFWKAVTNIQLTESDFDIRESVNYGKLLTLKSDVRDYLNKFKNLRIRININADNCDGLDSYCFAGFKKIYRIEINATNNKKFYILENVSPDFELPEIVRGNVEVVYA